MEFRHGSCRRTVANFWFSRMSGTTWLYLRHGSGNRSYIYATVPGTVSNLATLVLTTVCSIRRYSVKRTVAKSIFWHSVYMGIHPFLLIDIVLYIRILVITQISSRKKKEKNKEIRSPKHKQTSIYLVVNPYYCIGWKIC